MSFFYYLCTKYTYRMKKALFLAILIVASIAANAGGVAKRMFEEDPLTRDANVGAMVIDVQTGEVIDAYRANNLLPTASTMKVITTATALELLGGDFRWSTYLETDGKLTDGVLHGDLFIRGTGDPSLGSKEMGDKQFLQKWVRALQKAGIRKIDGGVVADLTEFDNGDAINSGWLWDDIGNYYGMGVFSINYLDNTMNIVLRSRELGSVAEVISTQPVVEGVQFENHIRCTEITYDGAYVHGAPFDNKRFLNGSIPANHGTFGVKGDIPNPGLLLAQHLDAALASAGVETSTQPRYITETKKHPERTLLYEHRSPELREIVKETNIHSNNLYAEAIFRTLGKRNGPATINQSRAIVEQALRQRGIDWGTTIQEDGCGLAPQNGIAPKTFVSLMRYMYTSKTFGDFYESLPVSGESGTLRSFLKETRLQGKVHAKSGSIAHLKSYTGYILLDDGRVWAFSVVVNNGNGKGRVIQKCIEKYLLEVTR